MLVKGLQRFISNVQLMLHSVLFIETRNIFHYLIRRTRDGVSEVNPSHDDASRHHNSSNYGNRDMQSTIALL